MQVKVFEAPDMATGLRKVRQELGPDALILSTRTVKGGKLGLLGKQFLEITAAIDNQFPPVSPPPNHNTANGITTYRNTQTPQSDETHPSATISEEEYTVADPTSRNYTEIIPDNKPDAQLQKEFDELKNLVKCLAGEISQINTDKQSAVRQNEGGLASLEKRLLSSRSNVVVEDVLLERGINNETARIISAFANEQLTPSEINTSETLYRFLQEAIAEILTIKTPDFTSNDQQKRIAFVGPTGVGKTTTLAKIAAMYLSRVSGSVALITIDTYRIAAVEQLKVYGEIMHLPVEVVLTPHQLSAALDKHQDKELILIDTAGRSHLDTMGITELQSYFPQELDIDMHLVLSTTTRDDELLQTIDCFSGLSINSTIFTKIDECSQLGVLLNTQIKNSCPISFITNGQRVPEDILEVDDKYLAQMIVPFSNGQSHDQ